MKNITKNKITKSIILFFLVLFLIIPLFNNVYGAKEPEQYQLLAPIGDLTTFPGAEKDCPLGRFLETLMQIVIGIIAVLAVFMIILGGVQYITSELVSSKEAGKTMIQHALFGLILALVAVLLLETLNPKLLNLCLDNIKPVTVEIVGDENTIDVSPLSKEKLKSMGIYCPGSGGKNELSKIANSFYQNRDKIDYSQEKRMTASNTTIYLDCSSFVKQIYSCAGLSIGGYNTKTMFNSSSKSAYDWYEEGQNSNPKIGDLFGWTKNSKMEGHIVMYIGNNKMIELTKSGVLIRELKTYDDYYTNLIR